jgi:S-DNA-T family DNA segregation ATPase FtsK/SpoIIIE
MEDRCPECGLELRSLPPGDAIVALRSFARRYRAPLTRLLPDEDEQLLRRRPEPGTWSALEYACHVRDGLAWWSWALHRTLTEESPLIPRVDPDEVAADAHYDDQDPAAVADHLGANAERFAAEAQGVAPDDWSRPVELEGTGTLDALWVLRHAVHEGSHHLLDIGRVLRAVRGR